MSRGTGEAATLTFSELTATNGGTVLLPSTTFFSGVTLNFANGTPALPALNISGTNLIMHGNAWRGYWVEQHDLSLPTNAWAFFRRVPLTNDFQILAPRTSTSTEFRAWEFIPDPYYLDLIWQPGIGVVPVLFAPEVTTLEVLTATNLNPVVVWETYDTVTMTNTFRIFPPEPTSSPERYLKAIPMAP